MLSLSTIEMAEFFTTGGFDFRDFLQMEQMSFIEGNGFYSPDCEFWLTIKESEIETNFYDGDKTVTMSHPIPTNVIEAIDLFDKGWWSQYDGKGICDDERAEKLEEYVAFLHYVMRRK